MISFENVELAQILFGKSKIFKFEFGSNSTIVFKVLKIKNLRMTTQTLSFSNKKSLVHICGLFETQTNKFIVRILEWGTKQRNA